MKMSFKRNLIGPVESQEWWVRLCLLRDFFFSFLKILSPFSNSSNMAWGEDKGRHSGRERERGMEEMIIKGQK